MVTFSRAIRHASDRPGHLSAHRRALAQRGAVEAWIHEGRNFEHCLEVRTIGVLGTVLLSRANLTELKRAIEAAEEQFDLLDERESPFLRPPEKLVF